MNNKAEVEVSIIIVNYNTSHLVNNCIKSIFDNTEGISYEIIVVDNNTENLSEVINVSEDERVKLLQLSENLGFGKANNAGVKISKGKYIFFLNPDTLLINNAVKILHDYLDSNLKCGACGGNLYDEEMNPTHSFYRIYPSILTEINVLFYGFPEKILFGDNAQFNHKNSEISVAHITGADLMIRRELFIKLQGFCPEFFMYYEETDLCRRVRNLKYSIISVPAAKIQHLEGKSYDNSDNKITVLNETRWRNILESKYIYYKRNHSKLYKIIADAIAMFTFKIKAIVGTHRHRELHRIYSRYYKNIYK